MEPSASPSAAPPLSAGGSDTSLFSPVAVQTDHPDLDYSVPHMPARSLQSELPMELPEDYKMDSLAPFSMAAPSPMAARARQHAARAAAKMLTRAGYRCTKCFSIKADCRCSVRAYMKGVCCKCSACALFAFISVSCLPLPLPYWHERFPLIALSPCFPLHHVQVDGFPSPYAVPRALSSQICGRQETASDLEVSPPLAPNRCFSHPHVSSSLFLSLSAHTHRVCRSPFLAPGTLCWGHKFARPSTRGRPLPS